MVEEKDHKESSVPLPLSVSPVLYRYLTYLARNTPLGAKETDVARYLLTERLAQMAAEKEHEKISVPNA